VSRNNPDETAKNFFLLNRQAGLPRKRTVTSNIVPWYVGGDTKIRAVMRVEVRACEPHLKELLGLLPQLRAVVLIGRKAQQARTLLERMPGGYAMFECPHPSPRSLNGRPERRGEILRCLQVVVAHLGANEGGG
jgi:uracil-DNA glycosylase